MNTLDTTLIAPLTVAVAAARRSAALRLAGIALVAGPALACTSASEDAAATSGAESELISDVVSMTRRADGSFDVVCRARGGAPNYASVATAADIAAERVCSAAPAGGLVESDSFDASKCAAATPQQLFSSWGYGMTDVRVIRRVRHCQGAGAFLSCSAWEESEGKGQLWDASYSAKGMIFALTVGNDDIRGYGPYFGTPEVTIRPDDFRPNNEGHVGADTSGVARGTLRGTSGGIGGFYVDVSGAVGVGCLRIATVIVADSGEGSRTTQSQTAFVR